MATFAKPGTATISAEEGKIDMDGTVLTKRKSEAIPPDIENIKEVGDELSKKKKLKMPCVDEVEVLTQEDVEESKGVSEPENSGTQLTKEVEEEEEDNDEDEEEEYEYEDGDDSEDDVDEKQQSNDPKGKGILKDEKGKGKLVEESENSGDSETGSDGESDLSDDPLTEVDLNNILPSRTRRGTNKPGVNISIDGTSKKEDKR